jgi:hypothetical protein
VAPFVVEAISQRFMTAPFRIIGFEVRATGAWLFSCVAVEHRAAHAAPGDPIRQPENNLAEVLQAHNEESRGSAPVR